MHVKTASKCRKQKLMVFKGAIEKSTIIVGCYNTLLSIMDRTTRQKIIKGKEGLNDIINQLDLTDIYRTFYLTANTHSLQVCAGYSPT